jgi:ATP-dependent Clp protease ATP-binding subunit ClpA
MIAQELEVCLHNAFVEARQDRHEYIGVEHLLLALLDSTTAANVLRACGAKPEELRKSLAEHIAEHAPSVAAGQELDTQPTAGFQRAIQRAILQAQSSGKREVTGADALLAIFGDKDSHAVRLLEQQGVTRRDVMNHLSQGATRDPKRAKDVDVASASTTEPRPVGAVAQELEVSLHMAFVDARQKRHEFITVEHLLLALLDNPSAAEVLRGCGANMSKLRKDVIQRIAEDTPLVDTDREVDTQPTLGFQRVIQRAILRSQASGKKEVNGADVLVAIFGEKDSQAVQLLAQHGIARFEVVFYRTHGVAPTSPSHEAAVPDAADLQVVLYNDDYTPMQFVVDVLQKFFSMSRDDATETMLEVHREGVAVCGLYDRGAAQELMKNVLEYAREHGHPLHCGVVVPK